MSTKELFEKVKARDPAQPEFLQAVQEVLETLEPVLQKHPEYVSIIERIIEPVLQKHPEYVSIIERIIEPERQIMFRVPWVNDKGEIKVNRGYRVQFNSAIGPYKGGLRFHPTVTLSIIKFLGFEQVFKNSLTTLPMGGGKGGSDFSSRGKSDNEIMRFCQAFMSELYRHIGDNTDVPAGDIGVSPKEVGYMFGQYKKLRNEYVGMITGKGLSFGGSLIRPEATGYGLVYFVQNMLEAQGDSLKGKRVAVSGAGNVAVYTIEKLIELGAIPVTASDSTGYVYEEDGFTTDQLKHLDDVKVVQHKTLKEYKSKSGKYFDGKRPWSHDGAKFDIALPCATQNEIEIEDAKALVKAGVKLVAEGANMPSDAEAIAYFHKNNVQFGAAKAANAGGVAVSGLEMSQNSARLSWTREEVDDKLKRIMKDIFDACKKAADEYNTHLQAGANIAGFLKVAEAMTAQGVV